MCFRIAYYLKNKNKVLWIILCILLLIKQIQFYEKLINSRKYIL